MIHFVIPAFNEEAGIALMLEEVAEYCRQAGYSYRIIVVDDGSQDDTPRIVEQKARVIPCELLRQPANRGPGAAFRRGFEHALLSTDDADVIVTAEADRSGDLEVLPQLLAMIDGGNDLVVASYYVPGGGFEGAKWYRKLTSASANRMLAIVFRVPGVHTYSSFLRAHRPRALRMVREHYGDFFEEQGYPAVVELLLRCHWLGLRVAEVPMVIDSSRRQDASKMRVIRTIGAHLRVIFRNLVVRPR